MDISVRNVLRAPQMLGAFWIVMLLPAALGFASLEEAKASHLGVFHQARRIMQQHAQPQLTLGQPELRVRSRNPRAPFPNTTAPTFHPVAFGADPTGQSDSSDALDRCMAALLKVDTEARMAADIVDLGGASIDLAGGSYAISRPVVVPIQYGNLRIFGGTLRALPNFPVTEYLIQIGGNGECQTTEGQGACNEFVDVSDILLDGSHVAMGCLNVSNSMGSTLGPHIFAVGFAVHGIRVTGGHETMISEGWFGGCYFNQAKDPVCGRNKSESVGIWLDSYDNVVSNVIVFVPTNIGVLVTGCGNLLTGVHTWTAGLNQYAAGIAIGSPLVLKPLLKGPQVMGVNRVVDSYLDGGSQLDLWDPQGVIITNNLFLSSPIILQVITGYDQWEAWPAGTVNALTIRNNVFFPVGPEPTGKKALFMNGTYKSIRQVEISDNSNIGIDRDSWRTTKATLTLTQQAATKWVFDFSALLVFPEQIEKVMYSVTSTSTIWFQHVARPANGSVVVIETSVPVDATVSIEVTQGLAK